MSNLKKYTVTLLKTVTTTETYSEVVEAENDADARVLGKYLAPASYSWKDSHTDTRVNVARVVEINDEPVVAIDALVELEGRN